MRMRVRSGWPSKTMPNMSKVSRSMASVPGYRSKSDGQPRVGLGHLDAQPEAGPLAVVDRLTTTSKRSGATPAGRSVRPG